MKQSIPLYPFQEEAVRKSLHFLSKTHAVYNACEMGLGKSLQAIETCNRLGSKKVLVICPAVVRLVWEKELQKWGHGDCRYTVFSYTTTANNIDTIKTAEFDTLILDEAHYVKNTKAQRTKAVLKYLWPKAKYRICLSGTPFTQSVMDCWSIFSKILPELGSKQDFGFRYCKVKNTPWGMKFEGIRNAEELSKIIRANFFIRYTKREVLPDLPAKIWQKIPLSGKYLVSPEVNEESQAYLDAVKKAYATGGRPPLPPVSIASWRREQGLKKIKPVVEFAQDLLDQNIPVIIFTAHKDVLYGIRDGLAAYNPVFIEGASLPAARARAVDEFQGGGTNLFIGNIAAAGVGITLTRSSTVLFAELDWSPANISQAVDRAHRIGQKDTVNAYYFSVEGSIDEDLMDTLIKKVSEFQQVLQDIPSSA